MSNLCNDNEKTCSGRREFLVSAGAIAGGLVLSLANVEKASANTEEKTLAEEVVIALDDSSPLSKVGGSQTVSVGSEKVIIARTGETSFSAVSAVCTHKGAMLNYDGAKNQFSCPSHGSKYGLDGSNAGGPSKSPLKVFNSQNKLVVSS